MSKLTSPLRIVAGVLVAPLLLILKKSKDGAGGPDSNGTELPAGCDEESAPPSGLAVRPGATPEVESAAGRGGEQDRPAAQTSWRNEHWQTIIAATIAVLTLITAGAAVLQWRTEEKSLRFDQRANVNIHSIRADLQKGNVTVMLRNDGYVPAEDIKVKGSLAVTLPDGTRRSREFFFDSGSALLFRGNQYQTWTETLPDFTEQDTELITNSQAAVTIGLFIQYDDGFGNVERADFSFTYRPSEDEWVSSSSLSGAKELRGVK